jgi:hypothetical protein
MKDFNATLLQDEQRYANMKKEFKYLTLYYDDFDNINYWYDICDQLNVPHNTLIIDIELTKVKYADAKETNILTNIN